MAFAEMPAVEWAAGLLCQLDFVDESLAFVFRKTIGHGLIGPLTSIASSLSRSADPVSGEMVSAAEALGAADRPGDRGGIERQLFLDLIEDFEGSRLSRSILLMKVMIGMSRMRQTSNSFSVRGSIPLAASMTMMAASTAVSVR
jgi:hypothetical protein